MQSTLWIKRCVKKSHLLRESQQYNFLLIHYVMIEYFYFDEITNNKSHLTYKSKIRNTLYGYVENKSKER